jgi:O-antigen ligase
MRERLRFLEGLLVVLFAALLPVSLTASWILLTTGVIVSIVVFLLDLKAGAIAGRPQLETLLRAPLSLPLALFLTTVTISGAYNSQSGGLEILRQGFKSMWSMKGLTVYLWARHMFTRDPKLTYSCLQPLLIVSAIGGVWGTIQQVFNLHPFGYQYLQGTGFHGGPMPFAGQMQMFSMLTLAFLACRGFSAFEQGVVVCGKRLLPGVLHRTPVMVAVTLANCLGLLFAGERSAWLGGATASLVMAALLGRRIFGLAAAALAVLAVSAWAFVPLVRMRLETLLNGQSDISVQARLVLWEKAYKMWQQSPLLGVGKFPAQLMPEAIVPGRSVVLDHAHSNYWHVLATTGAFGLITYLYMWIAALLVGVKSYLESKIAPWRAVYLGVTAGMVALLVSGAFEYNFGTSHVRLTQWFLLALLGMTAYETVVVGASSERESTATASGDNNASSRSLTSAAD